MMRREWCIGQQYGVRINQQISPWIALGGAMHFWPPRQAHIDLHIIWWLIVIGRHYHG